MYRPILFSRQKIAVFLALVCAVFLLPQAALPAFAERPIEEFLVLSPTPESVGSSASGLSDEEAWQLFQAAHDAFGWFLTTGAIPVYYIAKDKYPGKDAGIGKPIPENVPQTIEIPRKPGNFTITYGILPYGYNTEELMRGYLKTLFSDKITENFLDRFIISEEEAREKPEYFYPFISANGFLYVPDPPIDAGAQVFLYGLVKAVCTRTLDTADRVVYTAALEIGDPARESWNITGDVTFDYVLEKQNGNWVFTSFSLPYFAAKSLASPQTGDSAVFLLPAAALSLGGILLAAKKRKRTS